MKCPEPGILDGMLRAYLDQELNAEDQAYVSRHLENCPICQSALGKIVNDSALVCDMLACVLVDDLEIAPDAQSALARARAVLGKEESWWSKLKKEGRNMFKFRSATARIAATALAICIGLVVVFSFEPVRTAAEDFLGVFRAEKFTAVNVDPNSVQSIPSPSELGTLVEPGNPSTKRVMTMAEAQSMVPFQVADLPASTILSADPTINVTDETQWSFTFDAAKIKQYLASQKISSLVLPKNIDGANIKIHTAPIIMKNYNYQRISGQDRQYVQFGQTVNPTLEVPPDFDVEMLRSQILNSGLLPADLSRQLAAVDNWQSTLVIPITSDVNKRDVDINGAPGLVISSPKYGAGVIWQRNGVVYGIQGNKLIEEEALNLARSVK